MTGDNYCLSSNVFYYRRLYNTEHKSAIVTAVNNINNIFFII